MTRPSWEEYGLTIAEAAATRSACSRRKVGAYITDPANRPVSMGYNGPPPGFLECDKGGCPRGRLNQVPPNSSYEEPGSPGFCPAIHDAPNAIINARQDVKGGIFYGSEPPCPGCVKLLAGAGIAKVVFRSADGKIVRYNPADRLKELINK